MFALTLSHPYPWAFAVLGKRLENRVWTPLPSMLRYGDRFALHGGKPPKNFAAVKVLHEAQMMLLRHTGSRAYATIHLSDLFRYQGIFALVSYVGFVTESTDPWFTGPYGWILHDFTPIDPPIPCLGRQKLWRVPGPLVTELSERIALSRSTTP